MIKAIVFDYGGVIYGNLHWYNGMFDLAQDLKAKGYTVALLSNMYTPVAWLTRKLPSTRHFDPIIISCEVGYSKPDPEIYKILLDRLKLPPGECFFIDDRAENIAAAQALGIKTLHVIKPRDAIKELRKLFL